jgi:hypothetical protein
VLEGKLIGRSESSMAKLCIVKLEFRNKSVLSRDPGVLERRHQYWTDDGG